MRIPLEELLADPHAVSQDALGVTRVSDLLSEAEREQVVPLIDRALTAAGAPEALQQAFRHAARAWMLREAAEREAIASVLDARTASPGIFFKGASTAYSVYEEPAMRVREDWDLLVAPDQQERIEQQLLSRGFLLDRHIKPGAVRMRQRSYRRHVAGGECILDVHARVLNPPTLADRVTFAALEAEAIPLPRLHPLARGLSMPASLVLACMHRLAHHADEQRLAWDYDVMLLGSRITDAQELARIIGRWQASDFVLSEVPRVFARFRRDMPPALRRAMEMLTAGGADAGYARAGRSRAHEFALDWRALSWQDRARLARETFFPDRSFMRASTGSRLPLPVLYARRLLRGAAGWFRTGRAPSDRSGA